MHCSRTNVRTVPASYTGFCRLPMSASTARKHRSAQPCRRQAAQTRADLSIDWSSQEALVGVAGAVLGVGLGIGAPLFYISRDAADDEKLTELRELNRKTYKETGEYMTEVRAVCSCPGVTDLRVCKQATQFPVRCTSKSKCMGRYLAAILACPYFNVRLPHCRIKSRSFENQDGLTAGMPPSIHTFQTDPASTLIILGLRAERLSIWLRSSRLVVGHMKNDCFHPAISTMPSCMNGAAQFLSD